MDLSIIIVNYNVKEFLQNLLHSIDKAAQGIKHEIIIVDNASDDGSVEYLRKNFLQQDKIKLIANKKNMGFGRANNQGLKIAKGKFLLLLNPDTLLSEDSLKKMIGFLEESPDAGMAGCKILNPDGTLQLACRRSFPGPWVSFCKVTGLSTLFPNSRLYAKYNLTYLDENETYEVDAISGSFMMLKKQVYDKVGGFDEDFFMYGEDLDLCYRIQKSGYKVYYTHSTQIIHYKGESTKRSSIDDTKIFYNAMHLFVKKHFSSSFIVEIILQSAIFFRKIVAFLGKKKLIMLPVLIDIILFDLCLISAEKIYSHNSEWQGFPYSSLYIILTIPLLLQIIISSSLGVYKRDYLPVLKTIAATFIGFITLSAITFFFKQYAYSRAVVLITYILFLFLALGWRIILKLFFKVGIEGGNRGNRRTLFVGTSGEAISIAKKLQTSQVEYHNLVGLIGVNKAEIGIKKDDFEVLGTLDNIFRVIRNNKITEIVFSSNEIAYSKMMSIVADLQNENIEFKLIGRNMDFIVGKTSVSMLDDIPVIEIRYNISKPLFRFVKAAFDYTLALFALFLIYPFLYLAVWLGKKPTPLTSFILKIPSVFSGNISFVGPENINNESEIFLGKKGITGLWYLEGTDGTKSEKIDIFYARNQSLWLDLEILGKTIIKMWSRN
jgi:hypothetical protein